MADDIPPAKPEDTGEDQLAARVEQSRQTWRKFGMRVKSITPASLARFVLAASVAVALFLVLKATWVALTPFIFGAIVAYVVLPFVNWLDRLMPRFLAVVLVLVGVVAVFALLLSQLVPAIGQQVFRLTLLLPDKEEIRQYADDLRQWYQALPGPTQVVVDDLLAQAGNSVRVNLDVYFSQVVDVTIQTVLNLVNTVAFVLGFLVVPAWLLAVLKDQRSGVETIDRMLPKWMRADFWAFVRIADRTFRAFIDGQLVLGIIVGLLVYGGLVLLEEIGVNIANYKLLLALFAGLMQLIPSVGPIVAGIVFFLGGTMTSLESGVILLALYFVVQLLVGRFAAPHLERRYIDIHPAVLVLAIVALSEFGVIWVLLAAPVTAIIRDTYRYINGRLREPPLPAGVLPGGDLIGGVQSSEPEPSTIRVPLAYRRGRTRQ
jgi:predicted PurR-regulated permease PerM